MIRGSQERPTEAQLDGAVRHFGWSSDEGSAIVNFLRLFFRRGSYPKMQETRQGHKVTQGNARRNNSDGL